MDANGLKFWLLADRQHWHLPGDPPALAYDNQRRSLRLARQRRELLLLENRDNATARLLPIPQARDHHGIRAWYDQALHAVVAVGVGATPVVICALPGMVPPTDLVLGYDGVLYLAMDGKVLLHDLRGRWEDILISAPGFVAWRLTAIPEGGAWVLDQGNRRLARLRGAPDARHLHKPYTPQTVRPCRETADPARLEVLGSAWPEGEQPVALACSRRGQLVVLSWVDDGEAVLRGLDVQHRLTHPLRLLGSRFPYTLAWVSDERVAVLVCGTEEGSSLTSKSEARAYAWEPEVLASGPAHQYPSGDLYPLKPGYDLGPFLHGFDQPPHYGASTGSHGLHRLSFPFFTRQGMGGNAPLAAPLDSGAADTVWHRLYIEAIIPQGCTLRLWLAAGNEANASDNSSETIPEAEWFEHRFGEQYRQGGKAEIPVGSWCSLASELPFHPGLLPCAPEANRKGLFTVLVQRSGRKVRSLRGRYLHVRVELTGPGNATPELFALRAYGSRFSYIEHYLPRLYWERCFPPEADDAGDATAADFLERFVNNFEGILTPLEDRIAHNDLVTRPQTTPTQALEWLAGWIGFQFESGWSEAKRRTFLARATELYQWHGTLRGLQLALELATDGGVSGGEIVVLEDFRLRRTLATIIGADLDDRDHPLTLGIQESGNSYIGDTLFIGEEQRREFLALFAADLSVTEAEQAAIDTFFDQLAFRVTILVHQNVAPQDLGAIERIAEREVPAHVQFRILPTSAPLLVGITSLVGVDTYLSPPAAIKPARINVSQVGGGDYITGPTTLDPRLEGMGGAIHPQTSPPVARAQDLVTPYGHDFTLDGSRSEAAVGRRLTSYHWTFLDGGIDR